MYYEEEQVSLFDPDSWYGKTSPERSAADRRKEQTSQRSSKKSLKSQSQVPLCVCCRRVTDGQNPAVTMIAMEDGRLLGEYTMRSFGEYPREENASRLSQILEDSPHPKYCLSAKACQGILNRAERRGKELPEQLKAALVAQSVSKNEPGNPGGGKGILIQPERTGALSTVNNQAVLEPILLNTMLVTRDKALGRGTGLGVGREGDAQFTISAAHSHAVCAGFKAGQSMAGGIGYQEEVAATQILPFDTTQITSPLNYSSPQYGDPCHPLAAGADAPAIAIGNGQLNQISMEEKANTLDTMHDQQCVMTSVVRRMTPLECERLQNYPDGWTDIGEWVDSKGKRHKEADSPRYKALGNSIALPFWKVLAKRISAQYDRDITMGSLFDGISGFCVAFAKYNGPQNCKWASEIDEFPVAVCRKHFGDEELGIEGDYYKAILGRNTKENV